MDENNVEEKKSISKATIVLVLAVILILSGAGLWYFGFSKENKEEKKETPTPSENPEPEPNKIEITGNWVCTISEDVDNSISFIFNADGTGSYVVDDVPLNVEYDIDGNTINLGIGGMKKNPYAIMLENNVLSIQGDMGGWNCTQQ